MVRVVCVKCRECGMMFAVKNETNINNELFCSKRCEMLRNTNMEGMEQ